MTSAHIRYSNTVNLKFSCIWLESSLKRGGYSLMHHQFNFPCQFMMCLGQSFIGQCCNSQLDNQWGPKGARGPGESMLVYSLKRGGLQREVCACGVELHRGHRQIIYQPGRRSQPNHWGCIGGWGLMTSRLQGQRSMPRPVPLQTGPKPRPLLAWP